MNIKSIIYIIIIIFITGAFVYFVFSNQKYLVINSGIEKNILISNNTWETGFNDNIIFRKGDEIEYNLILKPNSPKKISIDIENISKFINIKNIYKDDKKIDSLNDLDLSKTSNIKIIGEAIDRGNLEKNTEDIKFISVEDIIIDGKDKILEENKDKSIIKEEESKEDFKTNFYIDFEAKTLNSNINNLIEIKSNKINDIKYVNIGGIILTPIEYKDKKYLSIDKDTFDNGDFFVIIQMKSGELITVDKVISFEYNKNKVNISNITPNTIKNDIDRYIVIQGNGFNKTISLQLSNNVILKNTTFEVINDNVMSIKIPAGIEKGEYYINIMKPEGIYEITNKTFLITN